MELVDPRGRVGGAPGADARPPKWPSGGAVARIGFLSNGKPNVAAFFARLSEHLKARGLPTTLSLTKPGPTHAAGEKRIAQLAGSCDVVIGGICDGGTATSLGAHDALALAARGIPAVLACTESFLTLARNMLPEECDGVRLLTLPHPFSSLTDAEVEKLADTAAPRLEALLREPAQRNRSAEAGKAAAAPFDAAITDEWARSDALYERGWTDGLPAFAPTRERVDRMLADPRARGFMKPGVLVPPRNGEATPEAVAANAVLAGMPARLLPYLAAALEAACDPAFNLIGLQTTTNPTTPAVIVGGPRRREFGFHDGLGALGPVSQANATLCRALRLCQQNLGGASVRAGTDPATQGQPGKYIFCFAEDEDANPWRPLRMQVGGSAIGRDDDAVTVLAATGTLNMIIKSRTGDELLRMIAGSIRSIGSNDYMFGGHPLLILCPEHAEILARDGWSLEAVQQRLFETTRIPFSEFLPKNQEMMIAPRAHEFERLEQDTMIPIVEKPADLLVCVAGGPSLHSTFVHSFGGSTPAVAKVRLRD